MRTLRVCKTYATYPLLSHKNILPKSAENIKEMPKISKLQDLYVKTILECDIVEFYHNIKIYRLNHVRILCFSCYCLPGLLTSG